MVDRLQLEMRLLKGTVFVALQGAGLGGLQVSFQFGIPTPPKPRLA